MELNDVFNSENRFFSLMNKVWDMVVLNLLFVVTVIVGIGPAASALYYAVAKNIRRSRGYAARSFFHAFKLNFKQGFIIGIMQLVAAFSLYYCYWFALSMKEGETISQVYITLWFVFTLLFLFMSVYIYPVLSRFSMSIPGLLRMSFVLSLRHLPSTILMVAMIVLEFLAAYLVPPLLTFVILCGASLYVLLKSLLMERILKRYIKKPEEGEEVPADAWYLE